MKISKETLGVFRNFNVIHPSLIIKKDSSIVSISKARNIISVYDPPEEFPTFGIFMLHEFLSAVSLFNVEETDFNFKDKFVQIKFKNNSIKYIFTDVDLIEYNDALKDPDKYKSFDKFDAHFELSESTIERIKKSSNILFSNDNFRNINVDITAKDGKGLLVVQNEEDIMSNKFDVAIENVEGDCSITFNVDYLIMLRGDYNISVLNKKLVKFSHKTLPLIYLITPRAI
jgi:hypothetical protein